MAWCPLTLRFVTPAFLDDPASRAAELGAGMSTPSLVAFPVASLRGCLRYWLRALVGAHVGNDLGALARVESEVFGAAAGRTGSPSTIVLRSGNPIGLTGGMPSWLTEGDAGRDPSFHRDNVFYLLGLGLSKQSHLTRRFADVGVSVELEVANRGRAECADLFLAALWALRCYGGLGARTRRGFGTIEVDQPPDLPGATFDPGLWRTWHLDDLPTVIAHVGDTIARLGVVSSLRDELMQYPTFAPGRYQDDDWGLAGAADVGDALAVLGRDLQLHRKGGHHHTPEYDAIVTPYLDTGRAPAEPFRIGALGLPVTYSDKHGPEFVDDRGRRRRERRRAVVGPGPRGVAKRRASPLWLRVHSDDSGWAVRSLAFFSDWLAGTNLQVTGNRSKGPARVVAPTQQEVEAELRGWFAGQRPGLGRDLDGGA